MLPWRYMKVCLLQLLWPPLTAQALVLALQIQQSACAGLQSVTVPPSCPLVCSCSLLCHCCMSLTDDLVMEGKKQRLPSCFKFIFCSASHAPLSNEQQLRQNIINSQQQVFKLTVSQAGQNGPVLESAQFHSCLSVTFSSKRFPKCQGSVEE